VSLFLAHDFCKKLIYRFTFGINKEKGNTYFSVRSGSLKIYLENVHLKDLDIWKNKHLSENRTVKRRKILSLNKAAG
jgi:hypothetical protein